MKTNRRGFFRIVGIVAAFLSGRTAAGSVIAVPKVHRATRNTRFGAIGPRWPWNRPLPPFNSYPGASVVPLPAASESSRPLEEVLRAGARTSEFIAEPLSIAELATLLYHTNGITDSAPESRSAIRRRAAPSAGALYSGEVYVIAERVHGLDAGLYYYAVTEHQLVRLKEGPRLVEMGRAMEHSGVVENAAAAVVLTNVFGRYSRRYANRGYRYALIDSGHIGENLRLAAGSIGLVTKSPLRFWDDALNELLDVDGQSEAVCAVHLVGRRGTASRSRPTVAGRPFEEKQQIGTVELDGPLPGRFHEATKLVPTKEPASKSVENAPALLAPAEVQGLRLPAPTPTSVGVGTVIRQRRSARAFESPRVSLPDLSFVLWAARGNPALERVVGVEVYVAAHGLEGVKSGVYHYQPSRHQLVAVGRGLDGLVRGWSHRREVQVQPW